MIALSNFNSEKKYSSLFLVEQINLFRKEEGNKVELLHKSLLSKIENEFEQEINGQNILPVDYLDKKGEKRKCYELTYEQSIQILASESKIVRKRIIEVLKSVSQNQFKIPQTLSEALRLSAELVKRKIQYKVNDHYVLTANYTNRGYVEYETIPLQTKEGNYFTRTTMKWTEKGRKFLHNIFNISYANSVNQKLGFITQNT